MSGRPKRSESSYQVEARGAIRYVPVTLGGEVVGYLWAAETEYAASFIRRLDVMDTAFDAPFVWYERLREASTNGLEPLEALRHWRGAPEDPEGGGIAADVPEYEAATEEELQESANPGYVDPFEDLLTEEPTWPDGTLVDRSRDWGPTGPFKGPDNDYPASTDQPVRYYPVEIHGRTVGYLWASVTDDAAYWQDRGDAGALGKNAGLPWVLRLREAAEEGLAPLQAIRKWKGAPEDPRGGAIPADADEQEASGLGALRELTGDYPATTDQPVRYFPVALNGRTIGYLWASVPDDAASFMVRADAGADGENARPVWERRLHESVKELLTPLQALRAGRDVPDDPCGGRIPHDAEEREITSLQALENLANE